MSYNYSIGTLVWARFSTWVYWPAIAIETNDENQVKVMFLAYYSRTGLVDKNRLFVYNGIENYWARANRVKEENQLSSKAFKRMFKSTSLLWDKAVLEADILKEITHLKRLQLYSDVLTKAFKRLQFDQAIYDCISRHSNGTGSSGYNSKGSSSEFEMDVNGNNETNSKLKFDQFYNDVYQMAAKSFTREFNRQLRSPTFKVALRNMFLHYEKKAKTATSTNKITFKSEKSTSTATVMSDIVSTFTVQANNNMSTTSQILHSKEVKTFELSLAKRAKMSSSQELTRSQSNNYALQIRHQSIDTKLEQGTKRNISQTSYVIKDEILVSGIEAKRARRSKSCEETTEHSRKRDFQSAIDQRTFNIEILKTYLVENYSENILFKDVPKKPICAICYQPGILGQCNGPCKQERHPNCAVERCKTCDNLEKCFACSGLMNTNEDIKSCGYKRCTKQYHPSCLDIWPKCKLLASTSILCPMHICHTCYSTDDYGYNKNYKLMNCALCPATFHKKTSCIPAGTILLSISQLICSRHRKYTKRSVNENWCFFCGNPNGSLVFCKTCPASFHRDCLKQLGLSPTERYICEICESGALPMYGEIVWAKFALYKWWPAIIVPPWMVPKNMEQGSIPHYFCVCFFGRKLSYAWMCKDRVYSYAEEDNNKCVSFDLIEAQNLVKTFWKIAQDIKNKREQTVERFPNFQKISCNKVVQPVKLVPDMNTISMQCDCNSDQIDPCGAKCLNKLTMTECNKDCAAGSRCQNQNFQKQAYRKVKVQKVGYKGFGLFAMENIPAGEFVMEYVGEIINKAEYQRRQINMYNEKQQQFYFISLQTSLFIDAKYKGNEARFVNHSCDPNCKTAVWHVDGLPRLGIFSITDIFMGTELTLNYNWDKLETGILATCLCEATQCSGFIGKKYSPCPSKG